MTLPTAGVRDIVTSHEGRVAQTARQMAASGWPWNATTVAVPDVGMQVDSDGAKRLRPDPSLPPLVVNPWIVPVINGEVRLQKPPLPYWVTAVMFKLVGVNEWSARAVPAILWALLTLIVADLAAMLIHPRMAVWAAGIWISSYFAFDEFRKCMADPYLAFFSIAAVWAGVKGMQNDECRMMNEESTSRSSFCIHHSSFIILFYLFLALGFLSKGPAVFIPVLAGIASAWTLRRPRSRSFSLSPHLAGGLLFFLIALPWYLIVWHRVPNALLLWKYESLGGFGEKNEKPEPFWFYLPQVLLIALPWTFVWIAGLFAAVRNGWRRGSALIWQAVIVLVFSLITQKKNAYLLPATAAQTLLIVQGLRWWFAGARRLGKGRSTRRMAMGLATLFAIAIAVCFPLNAKFNDNQRSAKAVCADLVRSLMVRQVHVPINPATLPPDAAFYLPLDSTSGSPSPWNREIVVIDDRRNAVDESSRIFTSFFPGRTVVEVDRLSLKSSPLDFRWKVFEVTLK